MIRSKGGAGVSVLVCHDRIHDLIFESFMIVSKPGVPGGPALPGGVPTSEALPGAVPSTVQAGIALPGPPTSTQQPQYLLPEHKMSPEEILYQLDQRFVLGEISEETYKEIKDKYKQSPAQE